MVMMLVMVVVMGSVIPFMHVTIVQSVFLVHVPIPPTLRLAIIISKAVQVSIDCCKGSVFGMILRT